MSLPTLAGVQSRIHNIPGHPQFMIIREMADALGLKADSLSKAFRRNREKFPAGYFFVLTPEQYLKQSGQIVRTAERSRTDLEQYAFTERGALFLLRFVTGEQADAGAIMLIDAFAGLRDTQLAAMRSIAFKDEVAYMTGRDRAMKAAIKLAVEKGYSFALLWASNNWSQLKLGAMVEEMRLLGYIPRHALFVPRYVFFKRDYEKELLEIHAEDARQELLALSAREA